MVVFRDFQRAEVNTQAVGKMPIVAHEKSYREIVIYSQ